MAHEAGEGAPRARSPERAGRRAAPSVWLARRTLTANWHETCTANAKPPRSRSEHGETGPRPGPRSNAAEKRPPPTRCRSAAFSFVRGNGGEIASDEVIGSREINRVNRNRRV